MFALPRLAYLTSLYPAVSHTFILREITALRELGFTVKSCSMRRPGPEHLTGSEERAELETTYYIIHAGKRPMVMLRAIGAALQSPRRLAAALGLAWRTAPPGARGFLKQMAYLAEALVLARFLHIERIDHLHSHFADLCTNVAMLAATLSDIPFSYTLHGPAEIYEPEKWALRTKTARAAFVACISHFARSQAMYFSDPAHWGKLKIIHCGVVPEHYNHPPTAKRAGLHLVFVGRLTPIKGLRILLEALVRARESRPDLHLTLIGDGEDRVHLEALAARLGAAVVFAGYRSQGEIARLLSEADALVLPSFAEGLPVVLMEAMASGRPVIATRVGGISELVEDGVSGLLVPPGDVESLAQGICRIADDPDLRKRMGEAGQATVKREFDVRCEAARIASLFSGQADDSIRPKPMETPV